MKRKIKKEDLIDAENSRRIARAVMSVLECRTYGHLQNVWKSYIMPLMETNLTVYQRILVVKLINLWHDTQAAMERRGRIMQGEEILSKIDHEL